MGQRASYSPGTFCWTDLTTPDPEAAKAFYRALFGWTAEDMPVADGVHYSMQRLDGRYVAAISPQPQQQREAGLPPVWNSYIAVADADATLARARELGGNVHADAFDVFDSGRMGVIQDPQGAHFAVWQARGHIGAGLVNAPGALTWNELYSPDLEAGAHFYGDLFGWSTEVAASASMPYRGIRTAAGSDNGGMATMEGVPPGWLVYFGTDRIEASVASVDEHGGRVMNGPIDIGTGQIAIVSDPQGALFALFAGRMDD